MPHRRNIDIDLLRSFVTIIEVKSFTRAAERLLRTQSAISLQMKRLEEQLDCRLFERGGRGVEPTQAGTMLLGYARRILAANDELVGRMAEPLVEGAVAIGAFEGFATEHLAPVLARFARAFPRARMSLVTGTEEELEQGLADRRYDMVITSTAGTPREGDLLMQEALLWSVADGVEPEIEHAASGGEPLRLVVGTSQCPMRDVTFEALSAAGLSWRIVYETGSCGGVQAAVAAGLGIGVLPRRSLLAGMHKLNSAEGLPPLPDLYTVLRMGPAAGLVAERLRSFLTTVFSGRP